MVGSYRLSQVARCGVKGDRSARIRRRPRHVHDPFVIPTGAEAAAPGGPRRVRTPGPETSPDLLRIDVYAVSDETQKTRAWMLI